LDLRHQLLAAWHDNHSQELQNDTRDVEQIHSRESATEPDIGKIHRCEYNIMVESFAKANAFIQVEDKRIKQNIV